MANSNEKIYDEYVKNQIRSLRYANGLYKLVSPILHNTDDELLKLIIDYSSKLEGTSFFRGVSKTVIKEFENKVKDLRFDAWNELTEDVINSFYKFSETEIKIASNVITDALPVTVLLAVPPISYMKAVVDARPFEGKVLSEWLEGSKFNDVVRITSATKSGIIEGLTPTQITRDILGKDGISKKAFRDLESILLTATNSIQNSVKSELYKRNSDVINSEYFVATLDARTTLECAVNDGKVFIVGKGPQPPLHFRCRSLRVPFLDPKRLSERPFNPTTEKEMLSEYTEEYNLKSVTDRASLPYGTKTSYDKFAQKRKRELIGQVHATTTYTKWFEKQSKSFQNEVLGVTKAKLYRDGKLKLDKFVDFKSDTLTLEQLNSKYDL